MKKFFIVCLLTMSILNCSKSDDSNDGGVKDQILTGTVEGKPFTFKGGKAFSTSFSQEDLISINLTNESADCDSSIFDFVLSINATVPKETGVFNDINIVTQDGNNTPFNSLDQTIEITFLSETEISGKMKLDKKESAIAPESIFEGNFTIPICQ